jgi:hypothetical protein
MFVFYGRSPTLDAAGIFRAAPVVDGKKRSRISEKEQKLKQFVNLNLNIIIIIKIPERLFPTDAR